MSEFKCPLTGRLCLNHKTIQMNRTVDGKIVTINLCGECAVQTTPDYNSLIWMNFLKKIFKLLNIDKILPEYEYTQALMMIKNKDELNEFLSLLKPVESNEIPPCTCGTTINNITNEARIGCEHCYEHFHAFLKPIIQRVQGAEKHVGKRPTRSNFTKELNKLQKAMDVAIKEERYEEAAQYRDRIKEIKQKN